MRRGVLIAVTITSFLTPFTLSSVNVALPSIAFEFSANTVEMNWMATSFLISSAMFLIPFGRLSDIYGRKRIFLLGTLLFSLFSLFASFTINSNELILMRFLQGIGGAMIFSTGIAILVSAFPERERGKVLGINTAAVYVGLSLGPFAGGILTSNLGWRSIFILTFLLGVIALTISMKKIGREKDGNIGEKFDLFGSVLYAFAVLLFIVGSSDRVYFLFIPLSAFLSLLFLLWESRQMHPVIDIRLFTSNMPFTLSNLSALINYSATFALVYLMSIYLQIVLGLDPQIAGIVLVSQPAVMALLSPLAGWTSDRIEPKFVASGGMALNAISLALLSTLTNTTHLGVILFYLVLMGLGFAFFSSPNTNAVMSSVDKKHYGIASATVSTMRVLGQTMSMAVVMFIFTLLLGNVLVRQIEIHSLMSAMKTSFQVFALLSSAGVVVSFLRGNIR